MHQLDDSDATEWKVDGVTLTWGDAVLINNGEAIFSLRTTGIIVPSDVFTEVLTYRVPVCSNHLRTYEVIHKSCA